MKHSTVGEALSIADEMSALCVVLTHFSLRYPRIPTSETAPFSSSTSDSRKRPTVVLAFDCMRFATRNLVAASQVTDVLRLLYSDDKTSDQRLLYLGRAS